MQGGPTTASIEYAISHLKVKLVVILGHEGCGAVKAAQVSGQRGERDFEMRPNSPRP